MSSIYSLKLICDLSFYLSFAGLICSAATGNGLLITLPYLFSCALLGGILSKKGNLRLAPLVLLLPALFSVRENIFNYMFFVPACAYTVYYVYSLPYDINKMEYSPVFKLYYTIAAPVSIIMFIAIRSNLETVGMPYGLMFTLCSIVLMRMLRHDKDILNQTKFKLMNALSVLGVMILGALAGSQQFLNLVFGSIKGLYLNLIAPLITMLIMALLYLLTPVVTLLNLDDVDIRFYSEIDDIILGSGYDLFTEDEIATPGIGLQIFKLICFAALLGLAIYLGYKIFKYFTRQYESKPSSAREERIFLDQGHTKKKEPRINHQIRLVYRKFLKLCTDNGIPIHPYSTTEDIARQAGNILGEKDASLQLRNIYIESRYGEIAPTKESIKQSKDIYNRFKQAGKTIKQAEKNFDSR